MKLGLISQIVHAQVIAQPLLKKMNIFNLITLLNVILGLFFIFNSDRLKNEYSVILIKINSFSIIFYYLFSFSPIISYRTSEVLEIVQIILLPQLIYIIKPKMLAEGIIIIVALLYFINQVLVNPILKPYVCIFQLKSFL
jgi:hypothetical protein